MENGQSQCSACENRGDRRCLNFIMCEEKERDTLSGSNDWYVCPDECDHTFCPDCDPTTAGGFRDNMLEKGFDVENCVACQGYLAFHQRGKSIKTIDT
eukprot:scaffold81189_cov58-Attheya_sp.AAC.1